MWQHTTQFKAVLSCISLTGLSFHQLTAFIKKITRRTKKTYQTHRNDKKYILSHNLCDPVQFLVAFIFLHSDISVIWYLIVPKIVRGYFIKKKIGNLCGRFLFLKLIGRLCDVSERKFLTIISKCSFRKTGTKTR